MQTVAFINNKTRNACVLDDDLATPLTTVAPRRNILW